MEETQSSVAPELNLVDLNNIKTIIDTAVSRGVFKASEFSAIGSVYARLENFVAYATNAQHTAQSSITDSAGVSQ